MVSMRMKLEAHGVDGTGAGSRRSGGGAPVGECEGCSCKRASKDNEEREYLFIISEKEAMQHTYLEREGVLCRREGLLG